MNCVHDKRTRPFPFGVRAEDSQEIIAEATIEVCLECCHVKGFVKNGSLFDPHEPFSFEAYGGKNIEHHAREALR